MITEEQIKKIYVRLGIGGFENITSEALQLHYDAHKHDFLLNAMFALIEDGFEFLFEKSRVLVYLPNNGVAEGTAIYGESKLDALEQAIIYALENKK